MIFITSKCLFFRINQKIGLSILLFFWVTQPIVSQELQSIEIADNVFVIPSLNSAFNIEKNDGLANAGFIIGPSGVIVINTGGSYKIGKAIIDKIKQQTSTPIVMVLLTHVDQNFVFGASAFSELGIYVGAHDSTINTIKKRCGTCLARLRSQHTKLMENTSLTIPSVKLSATSSIVFGGTELVLIRYGRNEESVGLMVYHPITKTLFAGGNLSNTKIPEIENRNIDDDIFQYEGQEIINGNSCTVILSTPIKESSYKSKKIFVDTKIFRVRKVEYFSENLILEKTLFFKDIVKTGEYWIPKLLEMKRQNGNYTIMNVQAFKPDVDLDDAVFSESFLIAPQQ